MHTLAKKLKKVASIICLVFFSGLNAQQIGDLDLTFTSGIEEPYGVTSLLVQSDGKIIVGGELITYNGEECVGITRINPDGTQDTSFNPGAGTEGPLGGGMTKCLALQQDGKILIGGQFFKYDNISTGGVARLNSDGSLDTTFNLENGGAWGFVYAIAIQPDGKILIGGNFSHYNGVIRNRIARLNTDGSLDTTFDPGSGAGEPEHLGRVVHSIALQSDGSMFIAGDFPVYNGVSSSNIAKLNSDGSLNTAFNVGTGTNSMIASCSLQSDGKLLIGGEFGQYNGTDTSRLIRLNQDGSLDTSFNREAYKVTSVYALHDGKILAGGAFILNDIYTRTLIRLNSDGSTDPTFNTGSGAEGTDNPLVKTFAMHDNYIYTGGRFTSYNDTEITSLIKLNRETCSLPAPEGQETQTIELSQSDNATLQDIEISGEAIIWYASLQDFQNNISIPSTTILESGMTYYATQTIDGCESNEPLAITVNITLGINAFANETDLKYFPNPVTDYLTISSSEIITEIKVFNMQGSLVKEEQWIKNSGNLNMEILAAGSYLLHIVTGKTVKQVLIIHTK